MKDVTYLINKVKEFSRYPDDFFHDDDIYNLIRYLIILTETQDKEIELLSKRIMDLENKHAIVGVRY